MMSSVSNKKILTSHQKHSIQQNINFWSSCIHIKNMYNFFYGQLFTESEAVNSIWNQMNAPSEDLDNNENGLIGAKSRRMAQNDVAKYLGEHNARTVNTPYHFEGGWFFHWI